MELEYTWSLLSSNTYNLGFWLFGTAGVNTVDPVTWGFYPSLINFIRTLPNPYDETVFNVYWSAYLRLYGIDQAPTLFQSPIPKYKFGTWAKSYAGIAMEDGFINYQYQKLASGLFCTQQELYTPYGAGSPFWPTTGIIGADYLSWPSPSTIEGANVPLDFGDEIYTQVNVSAYQELFLYAGVGFANAGENPTAFILL